MSNSSRNGINRFTGGFQKSGRGRTQTGFTILEILVAMFIFAIVVAMVFGSFDTVFSSADRVNSSSNLFEMGNTCLLRITRDLEDVHVMQYPRYRPPDFESPPGIYRFVGSEENFGGETFSKLRFTSLANLSSRQATAEGIAEIVYYVKQDENNNTFIKRANRQFPYPEFEERDTDPVMCEHVRKFKLVYFDHDGQEFPEWNSQDEDYEYSSPLSVSVQLVLGDGDMEYTFSTEVILPMRRYRPAKR